MSDAATDRELVTRSLAGDGKAVETLLGPSYCAPALGKLSRDFRIEFADLQQDFLIHLMENEWHCLRVFEFRSSLKHYLATIAHHFCCQKYRRVTRPLQLSTLQGSGDIAVEFEDKAQFDLLKITDKDNLVASLVATLRAIERLPEPRDRLILYMSLLERSIEEMADALGFPTPGATRTALSRARKRLSDELNEGGYENV